MIKKIIITENEKRNILGMYGLLKEQTEEIKQGPKGDPYQYKKVGDEYYYADKGNNQWTKVTKDNAINAIKNKIFGSNVKKNVEPKKEEPKKEEPKNFCPTISKDTEDIVDLPSIVSYYKGNYVLINKLLNEYSKNFYNQINSRRISCQLGLNKLRLYYKDKNTIIVDTLQKLLYVYDKTGKFIYKTAIISGTNKQSSDVKKIAQSLLSWEEKANLLGFKWTEDKGYVDTTGKNRKYDPEIVYANTKGKKSRFLPKGIFNTAVKTYSDKEYAGRKDNMLSLINPENGKILSQAIHGYYIEQPRTIALNLAKKYLNDPTNPKVTNEFLNAVSAGKINLSQSYGCINLPTDAVPILNKYMVDSYVFNIGETGDNYLVDNSKNYFDKMTKSETCPSPMELAAKIIPDFGDESTNLV